VTGFRTPVGFGSLFITNTHFYYIQHHWDCIRTASLVLKGVHEDGLEMLNIKAM